MRIRMQRMNENENDEEVEVEISQNKVYFYKKSDIVGSCFENREHFFLCFHGTQLGLMSARSFVC